MLANARAFFLLTADLTVTQARRKRIGVLAGDRASMPLPGLPGTLNPRPAPDACAGEPTVATGPGRNHWFGVDGNADGTYHGITCSLSENSAVLFSDN